MAAALRCMCPICTSGPTKDGFECATTPAGALGQVLPPDAAAKPVWSNTQIAANLTRSNTSWAATPGTAVSVTFGFRTTAPTTGLEAAGFSAFTAAQQAAARIALQSWADASGVRFVESAATTAQIVFANTTTGPGQAWAYLPGSGVGGDVWINPNQASNFQLSPGGYGLLTLIHEIGHALGLSHPGDYDASQGTPTYATNALYMQDSRQYTDMSYFSAASTGASHGGSYGSTPLLHDILAVQRLYGVNTTVRATGTVYGFNSTAGVAALDFSANRTPVVAIVDAGGTDTLDLSGYAVAQRVDLAEGAFSDIGGLTLNVAIAFGTVIENAVGSSAADHIAGNGVANRLDGGAGDDILTGGLGDDTLIGGLGTDIAAYAGLASAYTVTRLGTGLYRVAGSEGTDQLEGVEQLRFGTAAAVAIDSLAVAAVAPATLTIAAAAAAQSEGNSSSTAFTFTVTRGGNTAIAASANWAVTGSGTSAASASDFTGGVLPTGSVSFLAGETSKTITVNIAGDTLVEATEGFTVTLSAPAADTAITTAAAGGLILNDDTAGATLSIAGTALTLAEGNSGSTSFSFTVSRSGSTTGTASVKWGVAGSGTNAASASDFAGNKLPGGTVSFAAGETTKKVSFLVTGDKVAEANEGFTVSLSAPSTGASIGTATAAGSITNDDAARSGGVVLRSGQEVFAARDTAGRSQLWAGDIVSAKQLTSGTGLGSQPRQFVRQDSKVLFTGADEAGRTQLFATDGSAVTQLTKAAYAKGLEPRDFTAAGPNRQIFNGLDAQGRSQLWSTDGSSAQQLTSIAGGLNARGFTATGSGTDMFLGKGDTGRTHLWVTDGTAKGTYIVV